MADPTESLEDSNENNNPIEFDKPCDDSEVNINALRRDCYHQQSLLQQQPLLFVLLVAYADQQHWTDQQFVSCSTLPAKAVLTSINLPVTEANLSVIAQVTEVDHKEVPCRYEREELLALYQFFQTNAASQMSQKIISDSINQLVQLAELLAEYPALLNARFLKHGPRNSLCLYFSLRRLAAIQQLATELNRDISRRLKRCRHDKDLRSLQRSLEARASDVIIDTLKELNMDDLYEVMDQIGNLLGSFEREELEDHWFDRYGPSPVVANIYIIPLRSYQALFLESHQQHNCCSSYHSEVQCDDMAMFSVLAPERATLALKFDPHGQRYHVDQLLLKDNQPVSAATRRYIRQWLKRVQPLP